MSKRPTKDAWSTARLTWESDPKESYESIAKSLGVTKQAVGLKAKSEGWEKTKSLRSIVERAHLKADQREVDKGGRQVDGELDPSTAKRVASAELAEDVRADVLERHRTDWAEHRRLFTLAAIKAEFEAGKSAKISAEMLAIRQKGERAAYGLDSEQGAGTGYEDFLRSLQ